MSPFSISPLLGVPPFARFVFCRRIRATSALVGVLVAILAIPRVSPGADAKGQAIEQDGKKLAVLENAWLRLTVNPAQGGRVSSFIVKRTKREMIANKDSGLFLDHFYEQNWPGEFLNAPYECEVVEPGPRKAAVRLTRMSTGNWDGMLNQGLAGIQIVRTLTLPADQPVVECDVELKNTDTSGKVFTYWIQHVYRADGDSGAESRQVMTKPSCRGVHVGQPWNDWIKDSAAGWTAGVDPKDKVGLAFLMDYNNLWALYNCGRNTSEYMYDKVLLPGGMSWKTQSSAMLLEGLESVVYVSPRLAADIQVSTRNGALCVEHVLVAPAAALSKARVTTTLAWLNRNLAIGAQPSVSEVGGIGREPQRVKAEFPGQAGKPFIIQVSVEGADWKESYEFAYAGDGTGKEPGKHVEGYTMPAPPKHKQIIKPPVLTKVKNEKPRILELRGLYHGMWKVAEAARTLGECDIVPSYYKDIGDIQMLSVPPWDYGEIMKYDVIIVNNIAYGAMVGEQGAGMLKAYVENGGAVLFIGGPQAFGHGSYHQSETLKDLLPVELTDAHDLRPVKAGALTVIPDAPLADALAGKTLGSAFWLHTLKAKPDAQVWMRAGSQPAMVTRRLGKGRIAVILLTVLGEPAKGETPFWEMPAWPDALATLMRWLIQQQ